MLAGLDKSTYGHTPSDFFARRNPALIVIPFYFLAAEMSQENTFAVHRNFKVFRIVSTLAPAIRIVQRPVKSPSEYILAVRREIIANECTPAGSERQALHMLILREIELDRKLD